MPTKETTTTPEAPTPTPKEKEMPTATESSRMIKKQEAYLTDLIDQRIENLAPRRIEIITPKATLQLDGKVRHKLFEQALTAVLCGPVALIGPAGAGKTTLALQIAEAIPRKENPKEMVPFHFTGAIASEYKLMGFIDANGRIVNTAFRDAYTKGGVFLFDEIDASMPQAVLAFNNALANDTCDFPDGNHAKHPDFYVIAAANTYWTGADRVYVGRNQLDGATLDRFIFLTVEYDEAMEAKLTDNEEWVEHVQFAREAVRLLKIRHIVSPRATIYGSKLLASGIPFLQVEKMVLFKGMPTEDVKRIKAKMVDVATTGIQRSQDETPVKKKEKVAA